MTQLRTRLSRAQALELVEVISAFFISYNDSPVAIDEDLRWWADKRNEWDKDEVAASRRAIEAALPEFRRAAKRVLEIIGDA